MPDFKSLIKKPRIKRQFSKPKINNELLKSFFFTIFFTICLFIVVILVLKQTINQAAVTNVVVNTDGLSTVQHDQIRAVLSTVDQSNYLKTELSALKESTTSLSWVDEVSIRRDWHSGIVVDVLPKKAVAKFGSEKLVDAAGEVFYPANPDSLLNEDFVTLQGSTSKSIVIMKQMQHINESFAPLNLVVEDIILTPRMTWLIRFNSGLRLLVDGDNTSYKVLNASQALKTQLHDKRHNIRSLDLRYKNGFAISWKE